MICGCDNGTTKCDTLRCAPTFCDEPVIFEGECCEVCPNCECLFFSCMGPEKMREKIALGREIIVNLRETFDSSGDVMST